LIGLGREIANILFDKSYNRKKAEDKIKAVGVDNFKKRILSEEERKKYEEVSKSDEGKEQDLFQRFRFDFLFSGELINNFEELYIAIEKLLGKEIVSETLERLKDDSDLNNWVKQGFDLHKRKEEKERCLFCQKNLEIDFLGSLSRHFNKDYEELQKTIISLSTEIAKIKKEKIPLENEELYPNLRLKYKENAKDVNSIVDDLNNWVEKVLNILQKKHDNPLSILNLAERPVTYKRNYSNEVTDAMACDSNISLAFLTSVR
jgi:methyl-accepting chemotaxis protein